MESHNLIKKRNFILLLIFWLLYFVHIVLYHFIAADPHMIVFISGGILLLVVTAMYYFHFHPAIIMYSFFICYYAYIAYITSIEPAVINYLFLFLGIIVSFIYYSYVAIVISTLMSIIIVLYFYVSNTLFTSVTFVKLDIVYFILFTLITMIILLYCAHFSKKLIAIKTVKMNKTEDELYSAQEYLQSFFTYNRDAISVFSLDGKVIKVNDAFEQIYGWKAEEIVGKAIPFIPAGLKGGAESRLERVKKGEKLVAFETQDKRKDGKIIDVEITVSPIFNRDQQVVALFGISRDLTEEKETEKFLRQTDKLSLAGEMAAGIAHEIRNPLTSLNGFIQLIHEDSSRYHSYTTIMLSELNRINSIVGEFLLLAKPHDTVMKKHAFSLILNDVILLYESECVLKNVVVKTQVEAPHTYICCDANQIKQVLINLLKNALEAMPSGGEIHLNVTQHTKDLTIFIKDTGVGIPSHLLTHIQKPFFTTKPSGTGLGLVVIKNILYQHKGTFEIKSTVGEGTSVSLTIPLWEQEINH